MSYYGPWIQGDDFDAVALTWIETGVPTMPGANATGPDHFDPVRSFYDHAELTNTLVTANSATFTAGGYVDYLAGAEDGLATAFIDRFASGGSGADSTRYAAGARAFITATSLRSVPTPTPTLPPGAIGFDYEDGKRPVALGLTLDYSLAHKDADYTADPAGTPISGGWSTQLIVGGGTFDSATGVLTVPPTGTEGAVVTSWPGSGRGAVSAGTVDLTGLMGGAPDQGHVAVYVKLSIGSMPEPANPLAIDRAMTFGAIPTFTFTYRARPHMHRFLYPGEPPTTTVGAPPRRLWPRDDGLTGGAPRLSGSRSIQGSNRLSGGYV